jgi:hypothetical protein
MKGEEKLKGLDPEFNYILICDQTSLNISKANYELKNCKPRTAYPPHKKQYLCS